MSDFSKTCQIGSKMEATDNDMHIREALPGRSNLQASRSHHPGKPSGFEVRRIAGQGDLWDTFMT